MDSFEPTVVCLGHEAFTVERVIVAAAQQRGIPVASLVHTGFGPALGFRGITGNADRLLVWGEEDARRVSGFGVTRERIEIVGSLRYERELEDLRLAEEQTQTHTNLSAVRSSVVFLTAAINSGHAVLVANPVVHRETWLQLRDMAANHPDVRFVVKPHPAFDHADFWTVFVNGTPPNLELASESAKLSELLADASAAVLVNYWTTGALEALLAGVPVLYLRNAVYDAPGREDMFDGAIPFSTSVQQLERELMGLLSGCGEGRVQPWAQTIMARMASQQPVSVSDRVLGALTRLSEGSSRKRRLSSFKPGEEPVHAGHRGLADAMIMGLTDDGTASLRRRVAQLRKAAVAHDDMSADRSWALVEAAFIAKMTRSSGQLSVGSYWLLGVQAFLSSRGRIARNTKFLRLLAGDLMQRNAAVAASANLFKFVMARRRQANSRYQDHGMHSDVALDWRVLRS